MLFCIRSARSRRTILASSASTAFRLVCKLAAVCSAVFWAARAFLSEDSNFAHFWVSSSSCDFALAAADSAASIRFRISSSSFFAANKAARSSLAWACNFSALAVASVRPCFARSSSPCSSRRCLAAAAVVSSSLRFKAANSSGSTRPPKDLCRSETLASAASARLLAASSSLCSLSTTSLWATVCSSRALAELLRSWDKASSRSLRICSSWSMRPCSASVSLLFPC
mmetsp:Transcript_67808/g.180576  ORF Transcript_67808/g.180576 Transcript_67808/m.180576 type:complete len:227 (-) Transcript_67808:1330-2010(-)